MRYCRHLLLAATVLVTACGQATTPEVSDQSVGTDVPASAATAAQDTRYACPDGSIVTARYPNTDTAQITHNGQTIDMQIAVSASGARYVGGGWEWWTKGATEGTLSQLQPGEDTASAAGMTCAAQ